ncbi:terpenoid synthase [Dothidotthia symphoricarpi CBS 119687]|uniref:Terpene synthase n=1 Tax=Dothidotthia symphoricarpi CBS 119687 TaxID=1392245 RepID=A0A6A6A7B2_9PLEO|nr:terpenoid synthase [Dothidotthia symphoricarpi CBS 119687]KAF2127466.1 terpenoid synthase [Dothidotthia symphoricarpi CBS 119687]
MPTSKLTVSSVHSKICAPENVEELSAISYAYNWLVDAPTLYLTSPPPAITEYQELVQPGTPSSNGKQKTGDINAFDVFPRAAGLPWPTGFPSVRQSRHWKAGLKISSELLELFSTDATMFKAVRPNGRSLAKIAGHELQLPAEDRFTKFATYLFPEADKERTRLLAATIVFIVIFDDSWEMHSEDQLAIVRDDFIRRLECSGDGEVEKTGLQSLIGYVVNGLKKHDTIAGNAGQEVIDRLVDFCRHVPPQSNFSSLADYLSYRNIDAGVPYILACVKFSLESDVCIEDPKMATILRLISDHVSLVNDLASFDKELRAFEEGKVFYMINAVDIVRKLFGLSSWPSAKAITYTMQLEVEAQMEDELARLAREDCLSAKEEQFVSAALTMAAGNLFYSVVTSRYGGEACRIAA